jgi:hypothetical protein
MAPVLRLGGLDVAGQLPTVLLEDPDLVSHFEDATVDLVERCIRLPNDDDIRVPNVFDIVASVPLERAWEVVDIVGLDRRSGANREQQSNRRECRFE